MTPHDEAAALHTRLVHTTKVALVSRDIATQLLRRARRDPALRQRLVRHGGLDVAACETAGLAHDVGHPPFGHAAERVLDAWLREAGDKDGFEGNAQSLRVVSRLDRRRIDDDHGLDLTAVSLAALLKYPLARSEVEDEEHPKFGYYGDDEEAWKLSREALAPGTPWGTRSLEAEIMDLADDITYAMHDLQDFYVAGALDLGRVAEGLMQVIPSGRDDATEAAPVTGGYGLRYSFDRLRRRLREAWPGFQDAVFNEAIDSVAEWLGYFEDPYRGTPLDLANLREAFSDKISDLLAGIDCPPSPRWPGEPAVSVTEPHAYELQVLRHLAKQYVTTAPLVAMHERGQAAALRTVLTGLWDWARERGDARGLPQPLAYYLVAAGDDDVARRRAIVDYVCSLTDHECLRLARVLSGGELPVMRTP